MDKKVVNLYNQLNTKTIKDNDADLVQTLSNPVHLAIENQEVMETIKLVNDAALRSDGGPIPGTQQVFQGPTVTDSTRTVVFTPNEGEVWQIMDITAERTNITGTSGIYLYVYDTVNEKLIQTFYGSSSSTTFMITDDATYDPQPFIGSPCQIQFTAGNSTNWDDCHLIINMLRIR